MRAALERSLRRWWAGEGGPGAETILAALSPLSWAYGAAVAARNARYEASGGQAVDGLAVLSVGNLAVGGTGKTPLAAWVAREALALGRRPAVLTRGYADEVALHRGWNPEVAVVPDPDRVAGARRARGRGADVAVLDDGFQHRRLRRALDVVLLAAEDGLGGRLLPSGPFRETPDALSRAHAVVVTRRLASPEAAEALAAEVSRRWPEPALAIVRLAPAGWLTLTGRPAEPPRGPVLAACAVARPDAFAVDVRTACGGAVELLNFPDHHEYSAADARRLERRAGRRPLVITEKDAAGLRPHEGLLGDVRVLGQSLLWEQGREEVLALVRAALEEPAG